MSNLNVSLIKSSNSQPLGYVNDEAGAVTVYLTKPAVYEEISSSFSTTSINNPAGALIRVALNWGPSDLYRINDLLLQFECTNSDSSNSLILYNPFLWISRLRVLVNRTEVLLIDDGYKMVNSTGLALRKQQSSVDNLYSYLMKSRSESTSTVAGETYASGSVTPVSLSLLTLCPWLNQLIPNVNVNELAFEISFLQNLGSYGANNFWSLSSGTSNPNSTNITLNNIRLKQCYVRYQDPIYYNPLPLQQLYVIDKFESKMFQQSFNSTSDTLLIDLNSQFAKHKRILGCTFMAHNPSLITAYNDTDSALFYSGWKYVAYQVKLNSRIIVDMLDNGTYSKSHERRRIANSVQERRFNQPMLNGITNYTDKISQTWLPMTYIDLCNIDIDAQNTSFTGVDNTYKGYEIMFAGTSNGLGTSATICISIHYQEVVTIDPKTGQVNILS